MSLRHVVLATLAALLYATCYVAIKAGLAYAPPLHFAAWRALIGGAVLMTMLALRGQRVLPARRLWIPVMVLAIVGPVVGFIAMFTSPLHAGAGLASVVGNTGPLLIIVLAAIFLHEPITLAKLVALGCGLAGVTVIAWTRTGMSGSTHVAAVALPLLAAASGASESIIVKLVRPAADVIRVAAWQFLIASLILFGLAAWREPYETITWTESFVLLLVLLAGGATAAATALWYSLVRQEEVSRLSLILFIVPVAGLGLGAVLFGERIGATQALGIVLILGGVGVAALERQRILLRP